MTPAQAAVTLQEMEQASLRFAGRFLLGARDPLGALLPVIFSQAKLAEWFFSSGASKSPLAVILASYLKRKQPASPSLVQARPIDFHGLALLQFVRHTAPVP